MMSQKELDERMSKARSIYKRLAEELEPKSSGKIVAIHIETAQYFVGDDELQAYEQAEKKMPGCRVAFIRIGSPFVHTIG
jgi:hypothetical protein